MQQGESNATIAVNEEDWQLKIGAFNMPSDIHFIGWPPSPLGYDSAVGSLHAIIEKRSGLERNAWRCALHEVAIVRDVPCALMVCDTIAPKKTLGLWGPEQ